MGDAMDLKLERIRDLDDDHEFGGQDLPFEVTVRVLDGNVDEARSVLNSAEYNSLGLFNLARGEKQGTVTFLSFAFEADIQRCFGIEPNETQWKRDFEKYHRSKYVRTVGELRAAIADLPDDFPLVQTSQKIDSRGGVISYNGRGVHAVCGDWIAEGPGESGDDTKWSLRLSGFDPADWGRILAGTWKDVGPGGRGD